MGRQWLGDLGLAALLVLPTAGWMWPRTVRQRSRSFNNPMP